MIKQKGFYYDQQLKSIIRQFMAIFTGLQVQVGKSATREERLISVPITYGAKDRVVSAIIANHTQNKLLRLPTLSAYVRNIRKDPNRQVGIGVERRNTYTPVGGLIGEDTKVIHQRRPASYTLEIELSIFVSNTDHHFQILEQLLPIFDPSLIIQTSDSIFDFKKLLSVELTGFNIEQNYPSLTDARIIQSTMYFDVPCWIDIPADIRTDYIADILMRVGVVSNSAMTANQMIEELEEQNIDYEKILSIDPIKGM